MNLFAGLLPYEVVMLGTIAAGRIALGQPAKAAESVQAAKQANPTVKIDPRLRNNINVPAELAH